MKILVVLSTYPPHYYGGGEVSAVNLCRWLVAQGHDVGVITCADKDESEQWNALIDGIRIWRLHFPRPYTFWNHVKAPRWAKPLWYFLDHFAPRNTQLMRKVLKAFQPDCVNVHVASGIGYNSLREMARQNIPTVYMLHDLNLACMWGGMFKNGAVCETQCFKCKIVSDIRLANLTKIPRIAFCSPSKANLDKAASVLPLAGFRTAVIYNPNTYPAPTVSRTESAITRFLYVGRLDITKGVEFLLQILEKLAQTHQFSIDVLGDGAHSDFLRNRFAHHTWCKFHGHVSQETVSNIMVQSDILCTPSIWPENFPGVVVQALTLGLPVLGSAIGGIPEMIEHNRSGQIIPPGDEEAWKNALVWVMQNPQTIKIWGNYAIDSAKRFDADINGQKVVQLFEETIAQKA